MALFSLAILSLTSKRYCPHIPSLSTLRCRVRSSLVHLSLLARQSHQLPVSSFSLCSEVQIPVATWSYDTANWICIMGMGHLQLEMPKYLQVCFCSSPAVTLLFRNFQLLQLSSALNPLCPIFKSSTDLPKYIQNTITSSHLHPSLSHHHFLQSPFCNSTLILLSL